MSNPRSSGGLSTFVRATGKMSTPPVLLGRQSPCLAGPRLGGAGVLSSPHPTSVLLLPSTVDLNYRLEPKHRTPTFPKRSELSFILNLQLDLCETEVSLPM